MAEEENANALEGDDLAEDLGKGRKKRLIIFGGIGALALITVIAVVLLVSLKGGSKPEAQVAANPDHAESDPAKTKAVEGSSVVKKGDEVKEKPDEGAKETDEIKFGDTFPLKPFHLNLGNPLENRYVSLDITLEYQAADEDQKKELERRTPQIRDVVISIVSRKTMEFLLAPDGKVQLKKEILTRINRYMTRPIRNVYIADLLIE